MSKIDNTASELRKQIGDEIQQFQTEVVQIGESHDFSQAKLVRRIGLFENHIYPTGKFDSQGNYKHWFDIQTNPIDSEVKNIDFDTKNVEAYSPRKSDELLCIVTNLSTKDYMRRTGQAEEFNSAIEEGSGWGNVVWKKVRGSYERCDLKNFYVVNQTAKCLDESPAIERHQFSAADLRAMSGKWENIALVLETCGSKTYQSSLGDTSSDTTVPFFDIYERNGEVCVADLKKLKGETPTEKDEDTYIQARIIAVGKKGDASNTVNIEYILFAEEMKGKKNSDIYKEYHRGRYKGRWFREGIYELTFDLQVRGNEIGNQLARGLEFASKKWFTSEDKLIVQNMMTDMKNGDVLRTKGLTAVETRMEGFDQLIAEWNRIIALRNEITNSNEIVQGDELPSGTPFRLGALYNQNANKLYDFLREKLAIPLSQIFEEWIIPDLIKDLRAEDIIRLTGDSEMLKRLCVLIVEDWYIHNLIAIGPHTPDIAAAIKEQKVMELMKRPQLLMEGVSELLKNFKPHVCVDITGEGVNLDAELQTLGSFAQLTADPVRRDAIVELMARKKNLDFGALPKSPPMPMNPAPVSKAKEPARV